MAHDIAFLRGYLAARRDRWTLIAHEAEVARRAIAYIVDDAERDPRYSTVDKLYRWIAKNEPKMVPATATSAAKPAPAAPAATPQGIPG